MGILKKIYWIIPAGVRRKIENTFKYSARTNLTNQIINYYNTNSHLVTAEVKEVLDFLKENWVCSFPYSYKQEYNKLDIKVFKDEDSGLFYVLHNNHKMYFRESMSLNEVASNYKSLLAEQDKKSPHRYLTSTFSPNKNDVIIDAGAAEGIFSLNHIESAKKIYLIEPNAEWVKALHLTFEPWKTKVQIISKFASDSTSDTTIALDDICAEEVNFIKVDVEGFEKKLMDGGSRKVDSSSKLKICLCTYHKQEDTDYFSAFFANNNFSTEFSKGFMLSIYPKQSEAPYLRRGLIRAQKLN